MLDKKIFQSIFRQYRAITVWVIGLLVLSWGLNSLHDIFSQERDDTRSEILSRHDTLEQYAYQALNQSLQQQLAIAKVNLRHVLRDPLVPSDTIYFSENSIQILPRSNVFRLENHSNKSADQLYHELMDAEPVDLMIEGLTPWEERLNLLGDFKLAVESDDANEIRWAFREIGEHRSRSHMPGSVDIPYMLAVLGYLIEFSNPNKSLVENIIRTGTIIDHERPLSSDNINELIINSFSHGLQRSLIAQRHTFSAAEFEFLKNEIISVSKRFDVAIDDFIKQCEVDSEFVSVKYEDLVIPTLVSQYPGFQTPSPQAPGSQNPDSQNLESGSQWYLERRGGRQLIGVKVNTDSILNFIENTMKSIGLLELGDSIEFSEKREDQQALANIKILVRSLSLDDKLIAANERYWLKTILLFASAILVISIAVLVIVIQYRKQRYLALKSDFIATVSHELKTPLASVRLMSETLLRKTQVIREVKDYPERIIKSIDGMSLLVDNILSFNRLNRDVWELKKTSIYIEEVISELKGEFRLYANRPVNVEMEELQDIEISADRELLKILFRNLVNNACKYNEQESIDIKIKGDRSEKTTLYVIDNGIGISKNNWSTIFDEFSRVIDIKDKSISGTGLGLAICRKIMLLHQGDISVKDSSDAGTIFKLMF